MNYFDLPEYAVLAPTASQSATPFPGGEAVPCPLQRLVARLHRQAAAPRGYRFVANIEAVDLKAAGLAIGRVSIAGELRLESRAVDDSGRPVPGGSLYIRSHLPESSEFWNVFNSLSKRHAA